MEIIYATKAEFLEAIQEYREFYGEQGFKSEIHFDGDWDTVSLQFAGFAFICIKDKHPTIYRWPVGSYDRQQQAIGEFQSMGYKVTHSIVKP